MKNRVICEALIADIMKKMKLKKHDIEPVIKQVFLSPLQFYTSLWKFVTKSVLHWFFIPFLLYFTVYFITFVIALSQGARPFLWSIVTHRLDYDEREFKPTMHTYIQASYLVATKEVEDCDRNPREFYPNGYGEGGRLSEATNFGRGLIFVTDSYYLPFLGLPKRTVQQGYGCLPNSQAITTEDLAGKWQLSEIGYYRELDISTTSHTVRVDNPEWTLLFNEDRSFLLDLGCDKLKGNFAVVDGTFIPSDIKRIEICPNDSNPDLIVINQAFEGNQNIRIAPNVLFFLSASNQSNASFKRIIK